MAIPDLLRGCPLFFEMYDKEIEKLVRNCSVLSFEKGDTIVRDGEEGHQIFVLLEGEALVQKKTAKGLIKIQPLKQGDVFGEMVLVDEKMRSADIVAQVYSYVLEIDYSEIFALFKKEPRIFGLLILNLSRLIARKLKSSNQIILDLQNKLEKAS